MFISHQSLVVRLSLFTLTTLGLVAPILMNRTNRVSAGTNAVHSPAPSLALPATTTTAQSEVVGWGRMQFNSAYNHDTFTQVIAGHAYTLALRSDGAVVVWGDTSSGQADVTTLPPGLSFKEVVAGGLVTIARVGN